MIAPNVAVYIAVQESNLSTTGIPISESKAPNIIDNVTFSGTGDILITDPSNWLIQTDNGFKNHLSASSGNIYLESGDPSSSINLYGNVLIGIAFESVCKQRAETDRVIAWMDPATGDQLVAVARKSSESSPRLP